MMSYRRKIWLNPPDNENVRLKLIEFLEHISNEFEQRYPSETSIEEEVINQLAELRENNEYDMHHDNFAAIRYHLVRGLKYVDNKRAIELLQVAQKDPHDEVRAFANEILDEKIKPEELLFSKGQEFSEKRNYKRAIEYYIAALNIKPDYFDILFELGNTYIETDELENSIKYYTMALDVEPDHPYALNNRGRIYMELGKYAEAIQDFEKWLEFKPDDDEAFDDEEIIDMINEVKQDIGRRVNETEYTR